jgi:hypothetical protein
MKTMCTWEEVERYRDRTHRRSPARAVRSRAAVLRFVEEVGFCFAFAAEHSELPCLWNAFCGQRTPPYPAHTHHDEAISFVWKMKDELPAARKIYYGKLLRSRPTMVSVEFLPAFFVLSGRRVSRGDERERRQKAALLPVAREILDALSDSSPQSTRGLKIATGHLSKAKRTEFDRAITQLQSRMYIAKVAEEYDPFGFVWAPMERAFPGVARRGRNLTPETARVRILEKYFQTQLIATVEEIARLFRWDKQAIYAALGVLTRKGVVSNGIRVEGSQRKYYCLVERR